MTPRRARLARARDSGASPSPPRSSPSPSRPSSRARSPRASAPRTPRPSSARPPPPRRPSRPRRRAPPPPPPRVEKLPILIVAAGIEGSGHHMLAGVLDKAIASGRVARFNPWFQQLGGDIDGDYDRDAVRAEVLRASEPLRSTSDRAAVFYLDPSYPYSDPARNQPRHALQRPDLSAVLTTLAGAFDVRLVVLRRDPSRLNLLRFDPDRLTAAKIYDDNLSYLQAELTGFVPRFCRDMNGKSADAAHDSEALKCGCHKVLDYDAFLADPEAKVGALARWVGLEAEALDADAARGTGHEYDRGSDARDKRAWAKFDEQHRWKWGAIFEPKEGCVIAG